MLKDNVLFIETFRVPFNDLTSKVRDVNNVLIASAPSGRASKEQNVNTKLVGVELRSGPKLNYRRVTKQGISSSRIFINYNSQKLFVGFRSWQQHISNFGLVF